MYIIYIFSSCLALCVGYIVNDLPPKSKYHFPRFGVIFTLFSFVNHVFFIVFGVTFLFWLIELCINFLFAEKNIGLAMLFAQPARYEITFNRYYYFVNRLYI